MADSLRVTSSTFSDGETIPSSHLHSMVGGDNISPQLSWEGAPEGTQSYTVTCHDPDAPTGVGFVHWVLFNIPADLTSLPEGAATSPPSGVVHGFTDFGSSSYGGMAPPPGDEPHRYRFTVQALDVAKLDMGETTTYAMLRFATRNNVLAEGTLEGRFGR
ncbi:MAG: YbhB/YbcL family Raf kinase inhibitor-like protein [Mycobacteriales bacterium]